MNEAPQLGEQPAQNSVSELAELFGDPVLKSSVRLLILISLALNNQLSFTQLLELTRVGKGSLSNHLERLQKFGYIKLKTKLTISGPRTVAEPTKKGLDIYARYIELIEKIKTIKNLSGKQGSPPPEP